MRTGRHRTARVAAPLVVFALALAACGGSTPTHSPKPGSSGSAKASATPAPVTFSSKYDALKTGMTLDQVRGIMGSQGSTLSQADNGAGASSIVIQWQDPKMSSHQIIVDFINNMMMSKSALGF